MKALLWDAWRGALRRRGAMLAAMAGLTLAMGACALLGLLALALADVDPAIPEPERVVLLDYRANPPGQPGDWPTASPMAFAQMLQDRQAPLAQIGRVFGDGIDITNQGRPQPAYLLLADAELIPVLGLKALHGDLRAALGQRDGIAITAGLVKKLWGELPPEQALGRQLESRGSFYRVLAVIPNTDPRSPLAIPTMPAVGDAMAMVGFMSQANPRSQDELNAIDKVNGRVFARLSPGASAEQVGDWMRAAFVAHPLYAKLPADWTANREAAFFRGIAATDLPFEGEEHALRWQLLGVVAAACALLLLLAAFNAMNLQTAQLLQRQRETALRRALGANGAQLLRLWSLEVLLPLLLSAACALLLAWWMAPAVANWMGLSPRQPVADPLPSAVWLGLGVGVLLLLPLTLSLPAWAALRRAPAPALQGRTASEGPWGRRVRQALLTLQLGGALLLLSLAGVLAAQQRHLLSVERGFSTENRLWLGVMVNPDFVPNMDPFIAALEKHPAVLHWAFSNGRPAADADGPRELHIGPDQHQQSLRMMTVSPGFFDTYGMRLLAGAPRIATGETVMVIDAKAARLLGFAKPEDAVGAQLRQGEETRRVVAVVRDVKLESSREPALPQGFVLTDKPQWDISVHGKDIAALRQAVDELWKAHGPDLWHEVQSVDEQLAHSYDLESKLTTMVSVVSLLAVGVAMVGAYALVADTLRRRRTELVLRRLHGAGNAAIARQVAREFALPLLLAAVFGLPLAGLAGEMYLSGFVDRIDVWSGLALPLAAALGATVAVTALAAWRHLRLALALQPIEALA